MQAGREDPAGRAEQLVLVGLAPEQALSSPRSVNTVCSRLGLIYICVNSLGGACAQLGHCTEEAACFVRANISIYFCTWSLLLPPAVPWALPGAPVSRSSGCIASGRFQERSRGLWALLPPLCCVFLARAAPLHGVLPVQLKC